MNIIGTKIAFLQLLEKQNVVIPMVQREYTYGADTTKTNQVLQSMLASFEQALHSGEDLTLNFVYGYEENGNYIPLDGQQRLTTLFLLHFYAALYSSEADWTTLRRFTYETRETTRTFLTHLTENHADILALAESTGGSIKKAIFNLSWYVPEFDCDPSVRSMMFVLEKIEQRFKAEREGLWQQLAEQCPIQFYLLDFGPFGLGDELYVTMNSRGKFLTAYEIFKSQLLRSVEVELGDKELASRLSQKFDNRWTELVWNTIGQPSAEADFPKVDKAFVSMLTLILRMFGRESAETQSLTLGSVEQVTKFETFLDTLAAVQEAKGSVRLGIDALTDGLRLSEEKQDPWGAALLGRDLTQAEMLYLTGYYHAFQLQDKGASAEDLSLGLRHLRNLIENSDDEIRAENMDALLAETTDVVACKLDDLKTFNTYQINEEREKHSHQAEWASLFGYEEHPLLRGTLTIFGATDGFQLDQPQVIKERLKKFAYVFDGYDNWTPQTDQLIRYGLLTFGDYTWENKGGEGGKYLFLGCRKGSWRRFFVKSNAREGQEKIIRVLEQVPVTAEPFAEVANSRILSYNSDPYDWTYYAVNYREHIQDRCYQNDNYGYLFKKAGVEFGVLAEERASVGRGMIQGLNSILASLTQKTPSELMVNVLRSSRHGQSFNIEWNMLPLILFERNKERYHLSLGNHNNDHLFLHLSADCSMSIDMEDVGWHLRFDDATGTTEQKIDAIREELGQLGIPYKEQEMVANGVPYIVLFSNPAEPQDMIRWAETEILEKFAKAYPQFRK